MPDSERNALAARALRAKLAGNTALYAKLQARLAASAPPPPPPVAPPPPARVEVDLSTLRRRTDEEEEEETSTARGRASQRARARAVQQAVRQAVRLDACRLCQRPPGEPVLALAPHCRLALPAAAPLAEGHCAIVPNEHVGSLRDADDAVLRDVARFKDALAAMFRAQHRGCVFLETVLHGSRHGSSSGGGRAALHHTCVDVVPLDAARAGDAAAVFHEALVESEDALAQQHGVLAPRGRALAQCIPAGFPYVHVEVVCPGAPPAAFVRVVEDARRYAPGFARAVVAGLLDLPSSAVHAPRLAPDAARAAAARFTAAFAPYDWTAAAQQQEQEQQEREQQEQWEEAAPKTPASDVTSPKVHRD